MKLSSRSLLGLVLGACMVWGGAVAQEAGKQACERTRAEVQSECIAFLQKYRWDEQAGDYVLKSTGKPQAGLVPPEGVKTREQIRAERNAFFRANRWNESQAKWEPLGKQPRDVSALSRAEMRKETTAFVKTHQWDDIQGVYVERKTK